MNLRSALLPTLALAAFAGCFSVKTENEVKPIHITMDINLKIDKKVDEAFADETRAKPRDQHFKEVRSLLDRQVAGMNAQGLLVPRTGATDDDKIAITEANSRKLVRMKEIARESDVSLEAVQKRAMRFFVEKVPAGSGVWYQDESGAWRQK